MKNSKVCTYLIIIICLALFLRMANLFLFPQPITADARQYKDFAIELLNSFMGKGEFTRFFRGPGYPVFLAIIFYLFGTNYFAVFLIQIFVDICSMLIIFLISQQIFNDIKVGLTTAFLYSIYPAFIHHTNMLYSESLSIFLIATFIYILIKSFKNRNPLLLFIGGLLLGLAILCTPVLIFFPAVVVIELIFKLRKKIKFIFITILIFLTGFVIVLSPWMIRNYELSGKIIPVATSGGFQFLYAHSRILDKEYTGELSYKKMTEIEASFFRDISNNAKLTEAELDNKRYLITFSLIQRHPFRYILMCLNRFLRLWFDIGYGYKPSVFAYMIFLGHLILISLATVAFIFFRYNWIKIATPILLLIAYFTLVHTAMVAVYRYIVPVVPYLLLFSSYSLVMLYNKLLKNSNINFNERK